jgi:hypothetical protein
MKRKYWLLVVVSILMSGCGVDWFPESKATSPGTGDGTTTTSPTLSASIKPTVILDDGSTSTLTLTILNKTGNPAQSGLGFVDQLPAGVTATVASASQCGGNVSVLAAGTKIVLIDGQLASGTANCTISATLTATPAGAAEQSFVIKPADFTNLLPSGVLQSGVTDQTLKLIPTAVTSGVVTVSNLSPVGTGDADVSFTFDVNTFNTTAAGVNATVTVVALDANGEQIASTLTSMSGLIPPVSSTQIQISSTPKVVPQADVAKIEFWRILTVTVP